MSKIIFEVFLFVWALAVFSFGECQTQTTDSPISCGQLLYIDTLEYVTIESPNYPFSYENNLNCIWTVQTNHLSQISFTIQPIGLHSDGGDYLIIYDGGSQYSPQLFYTSQSTPSSQYLQTTSEFLYIQFSTNYYGTGYGFRISLTGIPTPSSPAPYCDQNFNQDSGFFTSPFYGYQYPDNADCVWTFLIANPAHNAIQVELTNYNIEYSQDCFSDYLEFRDGPSYNSPVLARLCGNAYNTTVVTSSSNQLWVHFHSDEYHFGYGWGFYASFKSVYVTPTTTTMSPSNLTSPSAEIGRPGSQSAGIIINNNNKMFSNIFDLSKLISYIKSLGVNN
jgi:hypothetical protein